MNLDDILVDLKLPPETLEVPVPRYFREDNILGQRSRDKIVTQYMKLRANVESMPVEDLDEEEAVSTMTVEQAMEIVQRNERGRQGKQRALLVKELRQEERRRRMYDQVSAIEMEDEIAAGNIQRLWRGYHSRSIAAQSRDEELIFIGMKPPRTRSDELDNELSQACVPALFCSLPPLLRPDGPAPLFFCRYRKRKQEQAENKEAYSVALTELKDVVKEEEGPMMRDQMREERTLWVTDRIAESKEIPDDLVEFYAELYPDRAAENKDGDDAADGAKADAKGKGKGKDKKDKKEEKKEKGKKGKKGKKEAVEKEPEAMPALQGESEVTNGMNTTVVKYANDWEENEADRSDNFAQKHDVELAKRAIRSEVEGEIREQVDEMLRINLKKIKQQINKTGAGKKKGKKDKKKKGKGKKGKKDKKGKKGKEKKLPGDKIAELKHMEADQMLSRLVEHKVINNPKERKVKDLVGDFNYLGTVHQHLDRKEDNEWQPPNPSMAQLRASITEYCILPLGSTGIKTLIDDKNNVKSIMLYGPSGSGKTMMAEAVASELGALFINLSPSKLKGDHAGKQGPTKLLHTVFKVASASPYAPVVIYMDDCDGFFQGGGKKAKVDKDGPARFKKDLITYKNAFAKETRVIFIGCTRDPEKAEVKDLRSFFDKFLYMPYPDYPSRLMLWRQFVSEQLQLAADEASRDIPDDINISTLAHISEGFTAGGIAKTVRKTLTQRRVDRLDKRPLSEVEFLNSLALEASKSQLVYKSDSDKFNAFMAKISGLEDRRKKIKSEKEANAANASEEKGKDKKKKK